MLSPLDELLTATANMRRYLIDVSARRQGTKILLRRGSHDRIIMPGLLPFANDRIGSCATTPRAQANVLSPVSRGA